MKQFQLIFFTLLFAASSIIAQPLVKAGFIDSFKIYRNQSLQEKLFVHTDKNFYLAGEICWFKIYVVEGSFHIPLDLSKIAYVEILNTENKPVLQAMIALQEATGTGSFLLPNSLGTGTYKLRAYTNWMKNNDAGFYFEKQVGIANPLKKAFWNSNDESSTPTVHFFPEGGNLVYGINSLVAFKVSDKTGKGIDANGAIINQSSDTVARFKSLNFGMGQFYFKPVKGNTYKAIIRNQPHGDLRVDLPEIFEKGWVMHVQDTDERLLKITVSTNGTIAASKAYLLAQTRLSLKAVVSSSLQNGTAEFTIDRSLLGDGISQLTIFNEQQQPVCERLFFKPPSDRLNIDVQTNNSNYEKRKKVQLDIVAHNNRKEQLTADMSVAVVLFDELQSTETDDILSYLWLRSDLKGFIENPAYYFLDSSAVAKEAADNLMLTQGWRRFNWHKILQSANQPGTFLPETDGHIVTGAVTDKQSMKPASHVTSYATVAGQPFAFKSTRSNDKGKFIMDMPLFYGSNEMIVQPGDETNRNFRVDIDNPFSELYSTNPVQLVNLTTQFAAALAKRNISTQAQQLYTSEKINRFYGGDTDSSNFYGSAAITYHLDDYTRFITMEEVIREYVKEIRLKKTKDQYQLRIKDRAETEFETAPLVLLDGMPVFDVNKLLALDPLKIRKIDVVQKRYAYGPLQTDGIVAFSSYKSDLAGIELDASALLLEYPGLQLQREFYSPEYNNEDQLQSRLPDFRNTLYWNPFTATDSKSGQPSLSFFTGDQPGKYAIIVQGLTATGLAGSVVKYITVR